MRLKYDKEVDALYVYLCDLPFGYNRILDEQRVVDYAEDHQPIGVEFLNVSHGVDVRDVPEQAAIGRMLQEHNFQVFA